MGAVKARHSGMFKPGQSGNPAGRPKNKPSVTALLREAMETVRKGDTRATQEIFVERLIELALQGEGWAVKEVLERMDGKVSQKIEQDIDIRDLSASITFGKKPDVIDVTPEPDSLPPGEDGVDK